MTYKNGERFALNHHAGFITLKRDAVNRVNLEYFSIFLLNFYRQMGVSEGSKTLSLTQIYSKEFDLPAYDVQITVLKALKKIEKKLSALQNLKNSYRNLLDKQIAVDYSEYQGKDVELSSCIECMSGNTGLTEDCIYQTLQVRAPRYQILSSATDDNTMMGEIPMCVVNNHNLKVFEDQEGLLVARKGKAGTTKYLPVGKYTINDNAYILFSSKTSPFKVNLQWLSIQYRQEFLAYASNSDNGTWNKTGFFAYTKIDIPKYEEQLAVVEKYTDLQKRIEAIEKIEEQYASLVSKEIAHE